MDNSNYNLVTSQIGTFNNLSSLSNNVANVNTPGYKEDKMVFEKYLTEDVNDNNTMPLDRATIVDLKQGSIKRTGRDLDFVIEGNAFFVLDTPLGPRYSKSGNFTINSQYELVNPAGYLVLGENGDPILFNPDDNVIMVDSEGIVYGRETAQDNFDQRGKLAIVAIENERAIRKAGDGLLTVEDNIGVVQANPNSYKMFQGFIEESNVVPITSMTKLVELQHKSAEAVNLTKQMESVNANLYMILAKTQ
jgi:flagellar basal-body rod protein FlgF